MVGFQDLRYAQVVEGFVKGVGWGIGFYVCESKFTALVGVEGGVEVLGCDAAGGRGLFEIEFCGFDDEVLAWDWESGGDFLEDEGFVLDHDCVV